MVQDCLVPILLSSMFALAEFLGVMNILSKMLVQTEHQECKTEVTG